jgi:hypothetical protein
LLGLSTIWLACGTLARDIEECQMQVVAVKPIARWQIWLGKWLGLLSLNAVLLALSGAGIYGLLLWRGSRLPADQQTTLRHMVLVARASAKPASVEREVQVEADRLLRERLQDSKLSQTELADALQHLSEVRQQILERVKADWQIVPPGYIKQWQIQTGLRGPLPGNEPLYLRIKFNTAQYSEWVDFSCVWIIGAPGQDQPPVRLPTLSYSSNTYHEFAVPSNLIDKNGVLTISFFNANNTVLLFPLEDGMEVLYRQGGFGLNFVRGLGIIFCWTALLAALGLASASFLSFPVAAFFSLGVLTMALSSGTMANAVSQGTLMGVNEETGVPGYSVFDQVSTHYVFPMVLSVVNLAKDFSPIDSLSTGRCISWGQLARAFGQIVLLLGGLVSLAGILLFNRRELATAQGTH